MKASQEVCPGADFWQVNQAKRHTRKQKQAKKYAPEPIFYKPTKQKRKIHIIFRQLDIFICICEKTMLECF